MCLEMSLLSVYLKKERMMIWRIMMMTRKTIVMLSIILDDNADDC